MTTLPYCFTLAIAIAATETTNQPQSDDTTQQSQTPPQTQTTPRTTLRHIEQFGQSELFDGSILYKIAEYYGYGFPFVSHDVAVSVEPSLYRMRGSPLGIAVTKQNTLIVAAAQPPQSASETCRVCQITRQGELICEFDTRGIVYLAGLAVAPDNGEIVVSDVTAWNGASVSTDFVIWSADGSDMHRIPLGNVGTDIWASAVPGGLCFNRDGSLLYVTDINAQSIHVYARPGYEYVRSFGQPGELRGQFLFPSGIAVDTHESVFVCDSRKQTLQQYAESSTGVIDKYVRQLDASGHGIQRLNSVTLSDDGHIIVSDKTGARIHIFDSSLQHVVAFESPLQPEYVVLLPHTPQQLFVACRDGDMTTVSSISMYAGTSSQSLRATSHSHQVTCSDTMLLPALPNDVWYEILQLLPMSTVLCSLACVSKALKNIVYTLHAPCSLHATPADLRPDIDFEFSMQMDAADQSDSEPDNTEFQLEDVESESDATTRCWTSLCRLAPHLNYVCLESADLSHPLATVFLRKLTSMSHLDLSDCRITRRTMRALALQGAHSGHSLKHIVLDRAVLECPLSTCRSAWGDGLKTLSLAHTSVESEEDLKEHDSPAAALCATAAGSLTKLDLSYQTMLMDEDVASLAKRLPDIADLRLVSVYSVGADSMQALLQNCTKLQVLYLDLCYDIDDDALGPIAQMYTLKQLSLRDCSRITDLGIATIASLHQLEYLDLTRCYGVTEASFETLSSLSNLRHLSMEACEDVNGNGIELLANLQQLEYLSLEDIDFVCDEDLQALSHIHSLRVLNISNHLSEPPISDAGVAALASMPHLREVHLPSHVQLSSETLGSFARTCTVLTHR
jgi:sugar lactone lactonase YvrE